jgi:hypothetical protein
MLPLMSREPATRASNAKDYLQFFARAYPRVHMHVQKTVPPEVLERIERGMRTDWIPIELDGKFVDAILETMGPDGMKNATREFLAQSLIRSPGMRSLFEGMLHVFGVSVSAFLRVLPGGLTQSYRDAFTLEVLRGDRETHVIFDDIAPELLRFNAYPVIWEGLFLGIYDMTKVPPQLDFKLRRDSRRMEARFRW